MEIHPKLTSSSRVFHAPEESGQLTTNKTNSVFSVNNTTQISYTHETINTNQMSK